MTHLLTKSAVVWCLWAVLHSLCAAEAPASVGWRGDGTGIYPDAQPPVHWSQTSKLLAGLKVSAAKPADEKAGTPAPDGSIRSWVVLGPVPVPDGPKPIDQETLPGEHGLTPADGDKTGETAWKKYEAGVGHLNFTEILGEHPKSFAYAFTNLFAPDGGAFRLNLTHRGAAKVVLNGKPIYAGGGSGGARINLDLAKGWNRLLLKVQSDEKQWFAMPFLTARAPGGFERRNLAWYLPLPGVQVYQAKTAGVGGPIVVKDRIYLTAEPDLLMCISKSDGKILWAHSNNFYDALSDDERKQPAFAELAEPSKQLDALLAGYATGAPPGEEAMRKLSEQIYGTLAKADKARFDRHLNDQDVGLAGFTPCSDGERVCVWFGSGVSACYYLDGKRLWIRHDTYAPIEHGLTASPLLAGGKLIVFQRDIAAFDVLTGKEAWRNSVGHKEGIYEYRFRSSMVSARAGTEPVFVAGNGVAYKIADGQPLVTDPYGASAEIATPVVVDGTACRIGRGGTFTTFPLGEGPKPKPESCKEVKLPLKDFPFFYLDFIMSSPLVHHGLAYVINNAGVLSVVDVKTGELCYQKLLDLDHFQSNNEGAARGIGVSPALAGRYVYLFGNSGASLVLEPGRTYKQVARNRLENLTAPGSWGERQERFVACPVFDGTRLYLRGESGLYAIEEK